LSDVLLTELLICERSVCGEMAGAEGVAMRNMPLGRTLRNSSRPRKATTARTSIMDRRRRYIRCLGVRFFVWF
jgi:hypothetical protein